LRCLRPLLCQSGVAYCTTAVLSEDQLARLEISAVYRRYKCTVAVKGVVCPVATVAAVGVMAMSVNTFAVTVSVVLEVTPLVMR